MSEENAVGQVSRRGLLGAAGTGVALAAFGAGTGTATIANASTPGKAVQIGARRKLGSLEVSAVGLGVQNMHRTYQTTIPNRAEMHRIIAKAHDHGVTLFDTAEAYGPHEDERILAKRRSRFAAASSLHRSSDGISIWRPANDAPA